MPFKPGYKRSQEVTDKIIASKKARGTDKVTEETREKISLAHQGKVLSKEHKAKIGLSSKGRNHTEETKEKIRQANLGREITWSDKISAILTGRTYVDLHGEEKARERAEHHSKIMRAKYEGVPRKIQVDRYHSVKGYPEWRSGVLKRDNYTCTNCGSRDSLVAHHFKFWSDAPELRLEVSNGRTLCQDCHKLLHTAVRFFRNPTSKNINQGCTEFLELVLKNFSKIGLVFS